MYRRYFTLWVGASLFIFAIVGISELLSRPVLAQVGPNIYIPMLIRDREGRIFGYVEDGGSPAVNIPVNLVFYRADFSYFVFDTVFTDETGLYEFFYPAGLVDGQVYTVEYENLGYYINPNHLSWFSTLQISGYQKGTQRQVRTFDISDVVMLEPADGADVNLPVTFRWLKRQSSSNELYRIWVTCDDQSISTPLTSGENWQLIDLPSDFFAENAVCFWEVEVYCLYDGEGYSLEFNFINFNQ